MINLFLATLLSIFLPSIAEQATAPGRYLGVTLPPNSKALSTGRFQSSRSYEDTKKYFLEYFRKSISIKRHGDEINLPHVRAIFYRNTEKNALFDGINIYLNVQTGLTDIFFVANTMQAVKP